MSYKAFDFNLFFYGNFGNKILNYQESNLETFQNRSFAGIQNVSQDYYNNYWTPTRPSTQYARVLSVDTEIGNSLPSSAWIENGSYVKLRNLTVCYTLPADISRKLALSRLRLYFSTQNLFTITKYRGLDPEIVSASQHSGALKIFELKRSINNIKMEPNDESAIITFKNGTKQKDEFYYGSSFLSQSGRFLTVDKDVKLVQITNSKKQIRSVLVK